MSGRWPWVCGECNSTATSYTEEGARDALRARVATLEAALRDIWQMTGVARWGNEAEMAMMAVNVSERARAALAPPSPSSAPRCKCGHDWDTHTTAQPRPFTDCGACGCKGWSPSSAAPKEEA